MSSFHQGYGHWCGESICLRTFQVMKGLSIPILYFSSLLHRFHRVYIVKLKRYFYILGFSVSIPASPSTDNIGRAILFMKK